MRISRSALGVALLMTSGTLSAAENTTYSYDALGRLRTVAHSGTVNDGLVSTYEFDKAGNRLTVEVIGSTAAIPSSPRCVAVVPLGGTFRLIACSRSP